MIYIHWISLVFYTTIIIVAMIRVLMDNRQPAKTMAWMLVLTFIPMLGIVLYFFFGQNTRKERKIWQHSMDQLTKRSMLEFAEQNACNCLVSIVTYQSFHEPELGIYLQKQ